MGVATAQALYEDKDFSRDLVEELLRRGGVINGNNIQKIECPKCNKREAFSFVDSPFTIHCPRDNKCGEKTHMTDLVPELFNNWPELYPPTQADPNATARAYLKSRGLDPTRFRFEQGIWKERGHSIPTVTFECSWTASRWHRLIDILKGIEGKARWDKDDGNAYQGQAWFASGEIDENKMLWIVEGIFEALSIGQGLGFQAAATFSASHVPTNFYEKLSRKQPICIALNSDTAGEEGTFKHFRILKEMGFENVKVAQPPDGKDWNDLLRLGQFRQERREQTLKDAMWRGKLLLAGCIEDYRKVFEERFKSKDGYYHGLLVFKGETYFCDTREEGSGSNRQKVAVTQKILNAEIRRAFTQISEEKQFNPEHRDFLKITKVGSRQPRIIELSAAELVNPTKLKESLKSKANVLLIEASQKVVNAVVLQLEKDKAPNVRLVERLGYDKKSDCFVFGKFLYDKNGKRHQANTDGFFAKQGLVCQTDEDLIEHYELIDLKKVISLIRRIYGNQGLMVLAFFVATLLKSDCISRKSAFPHLSLSGLKGSGKTTLIDFCNQAGFQLWTGINASRSSTPKGLSRALHHRHSLVIPYNESNGQMIGLDENQLLTAYEGGSLYTRAAKTNDSSIINLPFDGSLLFVQNHEPFSIGAVKERVISLKFKNVSEGGVTEDSRKAMKELNRMTKEERAGIGHQILSHLKEIRQQFFEHLDETENELVRHLQSPRVAFTHSVLLSACQALLNKAGFQCSEIANMKIAEETLSLAKAKDQKSGGENDIANTFFENFEQLLNRGVEDSKGNVHKLIQGEHYLMDEEFYWIRLSEVERVMKEAGYPLFQKLGEKIKEADSMFVKDDRIRGWQEDKAQRCIKIRRYCQEELVSQLEMGE